MTRKFTITLVLILFLLPFGSWYYLNSGLKWRQKAETDLSGTTVFPLPLMVQDSQFLTSDQLQDHVSLVTLTNCNVSQDVQDLLTGFYDQFKETKKANFIFIDTCGNTDLNWTQTILIGKYIASCQSPSTVCKALMTSWPADKSFALVDRHGKIRKYYSANTDDERRILLEHMALLLPRDRSDKVELKRGN